MYKFSVVQIFLVCNVLFAGGDKLSDQMAIEDSSDLESLTYSLSVLNTNCPPPTPRKRPRNNQMPTVSRGVVKNLNSDFHRTSPTNIRRNESKNELKQSIRELNLQQVLNLPDNTHLLPSRGGDVLYAQAQSSSSNTSQNSPISLSMPNNMKWLYQFTNQSPEGVFKPVPLRAPFQFLGKKE